ncbi:MAG: hypothetical protein HOQ32_04370 [Lysobacter sp.]|nr:hypothetical protein [Lysobacter sp.]
MTNRSAIELRDVVIVGSGFDHTFDRIAPGTTVSADVAPQGESGLSLRFRAGDRAITSDADVYVEPNGTYQVAVEVRPDLSVVASATSGPLY